MSVIDLTVNIVHRLIFHSLLTCTQAHTWFEEPYHTHICIVERNLAYTYVYV